MLLRKAHILTSHRKYIKEWLMSLHQFCNKSMATWTFYTVLYVAAQCNPSISLSRQWEIMSSHCLVIVCLILCVQSSSCSEGSVVTTVRRTNEWQVSSSVENIKPQRDDHTSLRGTENAETTNLRSWSGQIALHHRRHLRNVRKVTSTEFAEI